MQHHRRWHTLQKQYQIIIEQQTIYFQLFIKVWPRHTTTTTTDSRNRDIKNSIFYLCLFYHQDGQRTIQRLTKYLFFLFCSFKRKI